MPFWRGIDGMAKLSDSKKRALNQKITLKMDQEAQEIFKSETVARKAMSSAGRTLIVLGILLLLVLIASLCLIPYGAISNFLPGWELPYFTYSLAEYRELVIYRVSNLTNYLTTGGSVSMGTVLFSYLIVILAGTAMSASGAVYQGVFTNPMASPTTIGVQAGGMLGGLIYILFFYDSESVGTTYSSLTTSITATTANELLEYWRSLSIFERCAQQFLTLAGCFLGVVLILGIAYAAGRGKVSTVALMLAGSIFSSLITELGQLVQYYYTYYKQDELRSTAISNLIGGSYIGASFTWYEFVFMAVPIGICLIIVISLAGKLNIMTFGSDEARTLGINTTMFRNVLIAACTIMTATVLSFCGQVSMVGFMTPHFARYLVGPDFKKLVPASALLGGITTILIYDVCYLTAETGRFNMYTGVVCSAMSLFFILFYRRRRHADWA